MDFPLLCSSSLFLPGGGGLLLHGLLLELVRVLEVVGHLAEHLKKRDSIDLTGTQ